MVGLKAERLMEQGVDAGDGPSGARNEDKGEGDLRGMLGLDETISAGHSAIRTCVEIAASNAGTAQLEDLVRWAADHAPVGRTVRDAPANTLSITVRDDSLAPHSRA